MNHIGHSIIPQEGVFVDKIDVIREVPFFRPLRDEDLRELAEICHVQGYLAGQILFNQGEVSDSFYVIVAGEVEIRLNPLDGTAPKVVILNDGQFFGEMGVMRGAPRAGDAIIHSDSVLLKIMKTDFDRLMAVNSFFSSMVMESFIERTRQLLTARPKAETPPSFQLTPQREQGRIMTVFSPSGGSGTTFLACNIAQKLVDFTKSKVILIDMDLQFGTVELQMGCRPTKNTADLCRGIRIRSHDVANFAVKRSSGAHVLPRPRNPEEAELFSPDKVRDIITCVASDYDYVVIDTQSTMEEPNLTVLDLSQEVFMVISPEIPAISRMVSWLHLMNKLGFPDKRIRILLNRFSSEGGIEVADIEKRLKRTMLGVIPYDYSTALMMVNTGKLVTEVKPLSPMSIEISNAVREALFCQEEDDSAEARGEKPASFSLWKLFAN